MAENKKEYIGISLNECQFQGIVDGDPVFHNTGNGDIAQMHLKVVERELNGNNQWVDVIVSVPLLVMDQAKVETVRNYVKDKRQLHIHAFYKSWENNGQQGHGFVVRKMKLGSPNNYNKDQQSGPNIPAV